MTLTGGCMCGGIRFEVTEPPVSAGWCHCTRCQRRTGTGASIQARLAPGSLNILQGEDLLRAWTPPEGFAKVFCSECGSQLWSQSVTDPDVISVRFGAFDEDPGVRPTAHQFVAYTAAWETLPDDGLPRFDERRPA
jgi:hypothetical protein